MNADYADTERFYVFACEICCRTFHIIPCRLFKNLPSQVVICPDCEEGHTTYFVKEGRKGALVLWEEEKVP